MKWFTEVLKSKNLYQSPCNLKKVRQILYSKVAGSRLSWLVEHPSISDWLWRENLMLMYCDLWSKEFKIEYIVDQSNACDFTLVVYKMKFEFSGTKP